MDDGWKQRVRDRIDQLGVSMRAVSIKAGQGETFVRDMLERDRVPSVDKFATLAHVLDTTVSQLLGEDQEDRVRVPLGQEFPPDPSADEPATIGSETGIRGVPRDGSAQLDVTGGLGAGGVTIVSDGIPGRAGMTFAAEHVRDYWRLPEMVRGAIGRRAAEIVVFPVQGDSMSDTLHEGDFVFVDTRHRVPSPDGIYALADEFGGVVVKRLEVISGPRDEEARIRIISDNPRHAARERLLSEVQIIGRVVRRFCVVG